MRRRDLVLTIVGGAAAFRGLRPALVRAAGDVRRLGVLMSTAQDDPESHRRAKALEEALHRQGWSPGQDVQIAYRWAAGDSNNMRDGAAALAKARPDVLLAWGSPILKALRAAAPNTPTVFVAVVDPVQLGYVANLAHPGGSVTGFANVDIDMTGKWLDLLSEAAPGLARVVVIADPLSIGHQSEVRALEIAADARAIKLDVLIAPDPARLETDVNAALQRPGSGLLVMPGPFTAVHRELLVKLGNLSRVPAIYPYRYFAASGGLMSYGIDLVAQLRQAASYVSRIFKGEKAGDLPVQEATDFEFVVNLKTARQLGINLPPTFVARANEVIE